MAAVAAPRPDADPVTIAHKSFFDILNSPQCQVILSRDVWFDIHRWRPDYHIVPQVTGKYDTLQMSCRGIYSDDT
jgi:hypothetical protein